MKASFRLGRVGGVDVGVHWSVLIIFVLIAWLLAAGRLPGEYPGRPGWAYVAAGLSAAIVFFAGLLAHEVSHAVVARRNGVEVQDITLWVFGGMARLRGEASSPGAEARIAGAGPLLSLVIGIGFGLGALALAKAGWHGLMLGTMRWLAGINVLLAVFNLLPAAPLDGGRLLRAGLWRWRGDRTWAAVAAARAGRGFGVLLIVFGLAQLLVGGVTGGLWLLLIGWFIMSAAVAEEHQVVVGGALAGSRVAELMTADPVTAPADLSVSDFIEHYLWQSRHSTFPLVDGSHPVGLLTLGRIKRVPAHLRGSTRLRDVACPLRETVVATPDEPVMTLLPRLRDNDDGRALVISNDCLVGIVSPSDISRAVQQASLRQHHGRGSTNR